MSQPARQGDPLMVAGESGDGRDWVGREILRRLMRRGRRRARGQTWDERLQMVWQNVRIRFNLSLQVTTLRFDSLLTIRRCCVPIPGRICLPGCS